jgi:hypothetical protein
MSVGYRDAAHSCGLGRHYAMRRVFDRDRLPGGEAQALQREQIHVRRRLGMRYFIAAGDHFKGVQPAYPGQQRSRPRRR